MEELELTIRLRLNHRRAPRKIRPTQPSNPRTGAQRPTLMPPHILNVTRTLLSADGSIAHFATTIRGERVIAWRGSPPDLPHGLSRVLDIGTVGEQPFWIEECSSDHCLSDLSLPLPARVASAVAVQLADSLSELHALGIVHGAIDSNAVMIGPDGQCTWIGIARVDGTQEDDVAALSTLLADLGIEGEFATEPLHAKALASHLRTPPDISTEGAAVIAGHLPPLGPFEPHAPLALTPLGLMDEVQHEVGADAEGRGLLDRWDHVEDEVDLTDDSTESVAMGAHHAHTRQHVLSELFAVLDKAISTPRSPAPSFRHQLGDEPLDPIVTLNGLPHGSIHNPQSVSERTAEVSVPEVTAPSLNMIEETTGFTGPAPIHQSVVTGLLMAAVLGMVGAAVMLILVWAILGEIF